MSDYIVVLDDGDTYSGLGGCTLYRVKDAQGLANEDKLEAAEEQGFIEYANDLSELLPELE